MTKYAIYQARISNEAIDKINAVGWGGDFGEYEVEARIQRDVKFMGGSEGYTPEMSEYFRLVALTDAKDLDEVFQIGNISLNSMEIIDKLHSISIGDIIEDCSTGVCYMVDAEGFSEVEFLEAA